MVPSSSSFDHLLLMVVLAIMAMAFSVANCLQQEKEHTAAGKFYLS
jgi:hypothetical protein